MKGAGAPRCGSTNPNTSLLDSETRESTNANRRLYLQYQAREINALQTDRAIALYRDQQKCWDYAQFPAHSTSHRVPGSAGIRR